MTAFVKVSGAFAASTPFAKVAGVWTPVRAAYARVAGIWAPFYSSLSAALFPSSASRVDTTATITTVTTITATPVGGIGPFTYLWSYQSFSSVTPPTFSAGTSATTAFTQSNLLPLDTETADAICTITDTATGFTAATSAATITWTRT